MDEPFASLDAIVRARIVRDVAELVARERISVLLVTHDLEEAISLSDTVYLLSQGPRARITREYPVPLSRPRDPVRVRMHPAFAPLYEKIWTDLSHEVDQDPRAASGTTESSSVVSIPEWANVGPDSGACSIAGAARAPRIAEPSTPGRVEKNVRVAE
jgi:ABC-type glutathione transport system ATPase component